MLKISAHEAKQAFGKIIDIVRRKPVEIRRYNRRAAILITPRQFDEFEQLRKRDIRWRLDALLRHGEQGDDNAIDRIALPVAILTARAERQAPLSRP